MPESIVSGSSSSLTPRAGDATQVAKDGHLGSPSDSQPLNIGEQFAEWVAWLQTIEPENGQTFAFADWLDAREGVTL